MMLRELAARGLRRRTRNVDSDQRSSNRRLSAMVFAQQLVPAIALGVTASRPVTCGGILSCS